MMDLGANAEKYSSSPLSVWYSWLILRGARAWCQTTSCGTFEQRYGRYQGTPVHQEAYKLLAEDKSINFIGNVEARELLNSVADVVVTDGFTGNAVLKPEGTAKSIVGQLTGSIKNGGLRAKIGGLLVKANLEKALGAMDYKTAGRGSFARSKSSSYQGPWIQRCSINFLHS